jgi:hypothetical protein
MIFDNSSVALHDDNPGTATMLHKKPADSDVECKCLTGQTSCDNLAQTEKGLNVAQ